MWVVHVVGPGHEEIVGPFRDREAAVGWTDGTLLELDELIPRCRFHIRELLAPLSDEVSEALGMVES